ncbi:MAG: hypothetical protein ACR2PR_09135 [Pseudohongiellaceae bacterium]
MSENKHRTADQIQADKDAVMDNFGEEKITVAEMRSQIKVLDKEMTAAHTAELAAEKAKGETKDQESAKAEYNRRFAAAMKPIHEKAKELAKRIYGEDDIANNQALAKSVLQNISEAIVKRSGAAPDDPAAVLIFLESNPASVDEVVAAVHKDIYKSADKTAKKKGSKPEDRDKDVKKAKDNDTPEGGNPPDGNPGMSEEQAKFADDIVSGKASSSFTAGGTQRDKVRDALVIGRMMSNNSDAADGDDG